MLLEMIGQEQLYRFQIVKIKIGSHPINMLEPHTLALKHHVDFTIYQDVALFDATQSLKLILFCEDELVPILGIETYRKENDNFILLLENIADFSALAKKDKKDFLKESTCSAKLFVQSIADTNLFFEFIIADKEL